jgi:hypothetical protein
MSPDKKMEDRQSLLQNCENEATSLLALHTQLLTGANIRSSETLHAEAVQVALTKTRLERFASKGDPIQRAAVPAWWLALGGAVAAAMLLMLYQPRHPDLSIKGSQKIFLVVQSPSGERRLWDDNIPLGAGGRINAEINATEESIGFYGVYNRTGERLSSVKEIFANQLALHPAVSGFFNSAIELDEKNDGEEVVIGVCRRDVLVAKFPKLDVFIQLAFSIDKAKSKSPTFSDFCTFETKRLRL